MPPREWFPWRVGALRPDSAEHTAELLGHNPPVESIHRLALVATSDGQRAEQGHALINVHRDKVRFEVRFPGYALEGEIVLDLDPRSTEDALRQAVTTLDGAIVALDPSGRFKQPNSSDLKQAIQEIAKRVHTPA